MKRKDLENWMQIKLRIFLVEKIHEDNLTQEFIKEFQNSKVFQYSSFILGAFAGQLLHIIVQYLNGLL